jgi:hypothetical protein
MRHSLAKHLIGMASSAEPRMLAISTGSCPAPPDPSSLPNYEINVKSGLLVTAPFDRLGVAFLLRGIGTTTNYSYFASYHHQLTMYGAPHGFPPPPQQPAPPPSGWTEHLFYTNGKGTPGFEALMKEFFVKLDPRGTGYITPEAFSSFLEASRVKDSDNICKSPNPLQQSFESQADFVQESADPAVF